MLYPLVVAEPVRPLGHVQEVRKLFGGRHGRRAPVAGDDYGSAGVPDPQALLQRLFPQPAGEKATHKGVARAHRVEDLHGKAGHAHAILEVFGDLAGEDDGPHRSYLEHDRRAGELADGEERLAGIWEPAGYPDLLLRPHEEVALWQHRSVAFSDLRALDEHLATLLVGRHTPEHGPVVQVEEDPGPRLPGGPYRLEGRRPATWTRERRSCNQQRPRRGDELGVHIAFVQRHISGVAVSEDPRKVLDV